MVAPNSTRSSERPRRSSWGPSTYSSDATVTRVLRENVSTDRVVEDVAPGSIRPSARNLGGLRLRNRFAAGRHLPVAVRQRQIAELVGNAFSDEVDLRPHREEGFVLGADSGESLRDSALRCEDRVVLV